MKKFIAIILVLVTVLSMSACIKTGAYTDDDQHGYFTAEGKTKLTIGMGSSAMVMDLDNNALTKWVEEKCNVEIEFVEFAGGVDIPTQISTAISAMQELPDICIGVDLGIAAMHRYGTEGYIVDLQDFYADKEGASKIFWDRLANELTEKEAETVINKIQDDETGAIYSVPTCETSLVDKLQAAAWINVEWLDKLGLKKPTNTDELYTVLKAFKDKDPNGNGKKDEIPLYGGNYPNMCQDVTTWLMNMFTYSNKNRHWMMDENEKVYMSYTTDEYREGLKFMNKLFEEGLLSNLIFSSPEKSICTPTNGTALCGIFLGHLTTQAQAGNKLLFEYEPLKTWGHSIINDISVNQINFITDSCIEGKRAKAFEVLMTLWSWDGSMRQRYGEYGVNWTDPDPGSKSDMGLDATYKLINDPIGTQNTCMWPGMCALNVYAECETAQTGQTDEWTARRLAMHAEAYRNHVEAEKTNPEESPRQKHTYAESNDNDYVMASTNVDDYQKKAFVNFIRGEDGMDPNSDASWKAYLDKLYELGLQKVLDFGQLGTDRALGKVAFNEK